MSALRGKRLASRVGLALPNGEAVGQQQTGPTFHRYLVRAELTPEGIKNLQKQPPTGLKAGVAKFVESVGGKLEFWFFDYGESTAYSVIDYPDEVAANGAAKHKCGWFRTRKDQALAFRRGDGQGRCKNASCPATAIRVREVPRFSRVPKRPLLEDASTGQNSRRRFSRSREFQVHIHPSARHTQDDLRVEHYRRCQLSCSAVCR